LYIGQSLNLRQRWQSHSLIARLSRTGAERIAWRAEDPLTCRDVESELIHQFHPPFNRCRCPAWLVALYGPRSHGSASADRTTANGLTWALENHPDRQR
jgi:hypothetical protein